LSNKNNQVRSKDKRFSICGHRRNCIPKQQGTFQTIGSHRLHSLLFCTSGKGLRLGLERSQRSPPTEPALPVCVNGALANCDFSTCSPDWIFIPAFVSSWTTSRSTHALAPAITGTCAPGEESSRRMHRLEEVCDRKERHQARLPRRASRPAFCTHEEHVPSDEASFHLSQSGAPRRRFGGL